MPELLVSVQGLAARIDTLSAAQAEVDRRLVRWAEREAKARG